MLLMLFAESASIWTPGLSIAFECLRLPSLFHISLGLKIILHITAYKDLRFTMFRTELLEVDIVIVGYDLGRDHNATLTTHRLSHPKSFH